MTIRFGDPLDDDAEQPAEFHGTLRTWLSAQHYGFIARDDRQPDVFVHGSLLLAAGIAEPEVGLRLVFQIGSDRRSGRTLATHVAAEPL